MLTELVRGEYKKNMLFFRSKIISNYYLAGLIGAVIFFGFSAIVNAAEVLVSPSTGSYNVGQTFTATVRVDPQGQSVNAVEATLIFDTSKLSVVSVSKTGSVFSLWTTEPTFSNSAGTIELGGGSPTPFSTQSTLILVTFRAKAEGVADVDFRDASVLAADGLGTDVLSLMVKATYTIVAGTAPPETDTTADAISDDVAIAFGDLPRAPEAGSKTFLDPEIWYATTTGLFTWELPFDISEVTADVSTTSDFEPETSYDPPIEELLLTEEYLADGVQYFHIQFRNQVGWGAILHRKIKVDITPPEPFVINVRAGNTASTFPLLIFDAVDKTSGVERYELTIANREPVEVTPDEARLGYLLSELKDGTYTVKVLAYDRAGNVTESTTPVLITAGWLPPSDEEEKSSIFALLTFINIFMTLLIILIVVLLVYLMYERKQFARKETKLRKETKEIQDQMEKIFSALRDEIHEQIKAITKKPRLSKKERVAVEGLGSALEVSETLINKEIVDVQKILK